MRITETNTEEEARAAGRDHVDVEVDGWPCGFRGLGEDAISLQRCPACRLENYAMMVTSGRCYSCGFNINTATE